MKKQVQRICMTVLALQIFLQWHILSAFAAQPMEAAQLKSCIDKTVTYETAHVTSPTCAATGGEWTVLALARCEALPEGLRQIYLSNLQAVLDASGGVLSKNKYTEYARVILALAALDIDAQNYGGYPLLSYLADYDRVVWQGINGAVFALLALDSRQYEIPQLTGGAVQTTRENLLAFILSRQQTDGGWTIGGAQSDPDMTAMTLTALAPYVSSQPAAATAAERALLVLAELQQEDGGYCSGGVSNAESSAQVLVVLSTLRIPVTDERFVKNGRTVLDALLSFQNEDGSFAHSAGGGADAMATDQALYAMAAYARLVNGQSALYDMSDVQTERESLSPTMTQEEFLSRCEQLSDTPVIDSLTEVNLLLQELTQQGELAQSQEVKAGLEAAKSYIEKTQQAVAQLDQDIWNSIDPRRLFQKDRKKVLALKARYDRLQKADRAHVTYAPDLVRAARVMEKLEQGVVAAYILEGLRSTGESFLYTGKMTRDVTYSIKISAENVTKAKAFCVIVKQGNRTDRELEQGAIPFYWKAKGELPAKCKLTIKGLTETGTYELYRFTGQKTEKLGEYESKNKTLSLEMHRGGNYYLRKKEKQLTTQPESKAPSVGGQKTEDAAQQAEAQQSIEPPRAGSREPATEQHSAAGQNVEPPRAGWQPSSGSAEQAGRPQAKQSFTAAEIEAVMGREENLYYEQTDGFAYKAVIHGTDITRAMALVMTVTEETEYEKEIRALAAQPFAFWVQQEELPGELYLKLQTGQRDGAYLLCRYEPDQKASEVVKKVSVEDGMAQLTIPQGGHYFLTTRVKQETASAGEAGQEQTGQSMEEKVGQEMRQQLFKELRENPIPLVFCAVGLLGSVTLAGYAVWTLAIRKK